MINHPQRGFPSQFKPTAKARRAEQLVKIAYKLEHLAAVLAGEGHASESASIRAAAATIGNVGRSMRRDKA
jgi:hypothetical protein